MATKEIKAKDMTTREMLEAIINGKMDTKSSNGQTVTEKAQAMLDSIDKRNAANKEKDRPSKPKVDNTEAKAVILAFLAEQEKPLVAKAIADGVEMTVQKTSAVLRQLVADEAIERIEISRSKPLEYSKVN